MYALDIQDLKKTYANGVSALKGITLTVGVGEFIGLLGPNGAGKSTTIGIVNSLVRKTSGSVKIFGYDADTQPTDAKSQIGVVPQEFNFSIFEKVIDILVHQAGYYGIARKAAFVSAEKYLKLLELWDKRNQVARTLSGGMKRRLMIARALVHEPRLLILDEPTAGVDVEIRRSMWHFLKKLNANGRTIILTTHYLEEAETLCDRIAIINQGSIIKDTSTKELLTHLSKETVILDLAKPLLRLPVHENHFEFEIIDDRTLSVSFSKSTPLNALFALLDHNNIQVVSMRNHANRLETLFLNLTQSENTP